MGGIIITIGSTRFIIRILMVKCCTYHIDAMDLPMVYALIESLYSSQHLKDL